MPALVLLAETGQQPLAARWVAQMGRFWNAVLAVDWDSLVRRALLDSRAMTAEVGRDGVAQQPWVGQVVAALRAYGVELDLSEPAPVSVTDLVQAAATSSRQQLATAQGTCICQYVAATGADTGVGLLDYLLSLQHRSRRRAVARLNAG